MLHLGKLTLGFGLLFALLASAEDRKDTKEASTPIVGAYTIESGEKNGKPIESDHLKDCTVRIAANAITTFDKSKKEMYAATYKLDTTQTPWRISMTATITAAKDNQGSGTKAEGLVAQDGNTLKLIYALPGGKTPTEWKTADKQLMLVLKKAPK